MKLEHEVRKYRITGITPILGSAPASKEIRTKYILSKCEDEKTREAEAIENQYDLDEKGLTVFNRNRNDQLCVMAYQFKGFLKQAFKSAKTQLKVGNPASKIDKLVFISPMFIPLLRDGEPIRDEDDVLERPLRASTPMGERVALASSEMVEDPWGFDISITLIPNSGTKASEAVTWDEVETAMDYGMFNGLGQWRNADYGKFRWERIA